MQSILITGCSSGFGLETAKYFAGRGWRVIATMRTPDASIIPTAPNLELLQLDVADPASIAQAVAAAGEIDVLVNNAGIGWLNALEGTPMDMIRRICRDGTGTVCKGRFGERLSLSVSTGDVSILYSKSSGVRLHDLTGKTSLVAPEKMSLVAHGRTPYLPIGRVWMRTSLPPIKPS
jgi:hypothetical protein